jgi:hypothetical protein
MIVPDDKKSSKGEVEDIMFRYPEIPGCRCRKADLHESICYCGKPIGWHVKWGHGCGNVCYGHGRHILKLANRGNRWQEFMYRLSETEAAIADPTR